ncbi:hypothetical protein UFOVP1492_16 [uncultured Caudovirales phage]|uniref:Uncharacterized protein n=1 Tax=uncultured Caudovirales phage TaxID=2100421 RepID=A0A6J5SR32_9CAUD|nr:hypothetical protein UFOVP1127_118 [uncultured Caudovirales phage]CAB4193505.1 hypothetical protein UFOVP1242_92 [uncultured Caudovirales phage]CAB4217224.1 hypothetical protein UFOVP1492_16 [uncultured Caudovirales phage]CAB5231257.1 hypothetical protein UFOVP1580_45 [uncultured Caudovirales phage]
MAGSGLHHFASAMLRGRITQDQINNLDPAEYEDQQFEYWYHHLDEVLRDSGIAQFTCTCGHTGAQRDLVKKRERGVFRDSCPSCGALEYRDWGVPDQSTSHLSVDRYRGLRKEDNQEALTKQYVDGLMSIEQDTESNFQALRIQSLEYSLSVCLKQLKSFVEALGDESHAGFVSEEDLDAIAEAELLLGLTPPQQRQAKIDEINADTPPAAGYARQWLECKECQRLQYYDYVPYSLSNPSNTSACGHDMANMERLEIPDRVAVRAKEMREKGLLFGMRYASNQGKI